MTLREELLQAGVPEHVSDEGALDVDRVERNITMAHLSRIKVRAEGDKIIFESVVGERRRVEVEAARLWNPDHGRPLTASELSEQLGVLRKPSKDEVSAEEARQARELGTVVGVDLETLTALVLVEGIKGFGPQKFKELHDAGVTPREVVDRPELLPTRGKRGDQFRSALARLSDGDHQLALHRAARQIVRAAEHDARVLTFDDPLYPPNVLESNNPIPILYARGEFSVLRERRAIACVGSRNIRPPYSELHRHFAETAVAEGFVIASGFALGADTIGHVAARDAGGKTIIVMPSGLDRPFPPENRGLWDDLLRHKGAVFVSEFPFGTAAASLTLRKRNKLIVAFARAVLLSQSSTKGGAMNAYRFALEQKKPVATFAGDGTGDTSGNKFISAELEQAEPLVLDGPHSVVFPAVEQRDVWREWLRQL